MRKKQPARKLVSKAEAKKAARTVFATALEILDEIICPVVEIKGVYADLFLAEPDLYLSRTKKVAVVQRKKIITAVAERFDADEYALARSWWQPLALFALAAMSQTSYVRSDGKGESNFRRLGARDAWNWLEAEDRRRARARRERARAKRIAEMAPARSRRRTPS